MNRKVEITNYIIKQLNLISPNEKSFKSWLYKIWQNPRMKDRGGLRLTLDGFDLFCKADIKYFEVQIEDPDFSIENKFILWLDRMFDCPFYITRRKIYFFDKNPAVQLILFSGNIQKFYQAYQRSQEKATEST